MGDQIGDAALARFVGRRLVQAVPLLFLISVVVFALIHAAPGGPLEIYLSNPNVRPQDIERLRRALGLDRPLWMQYVSWLAAFARGDWGYSFSDGRAVTTRIFERLPATLELVATSMVAALIVAIPAGTIAATRRGRWFDRTTTAAAVAGISLPAFWLGLVLQMIFALALGWLPSSGRSTLGDGGVSDRLAHLVLPATLLALVQAAGWSRYLRASLIEVLAQPFIVAARARGVPERQVVWRHALRSAAGPTLTVVLVDAALLVSGAVVTESVFAWPGLGSLFTEALARRDYTVLMALLMLTSTAIVALNVIADVVYALLDPRVNA
jgi:peptide/nickel transport system permease protein